MDKVNPTVNKIGSSQSQITNHLRSWSTLVLIFFNTLNLVKVEIETQGILISFHHRHRVIYY